MIKIEKGSIKKYIINYISSLKNNNDKLDMFSINAIVGILSDKIKHYYIFVNAGGQDFHIRYNNDTFWEDSVEKDYVSVICNIKEEERFIIFKSVNGIEYYNPNALTHLHDDISRILFPIKHRSEELKSI